MKKNIQIFINIFFFTFLFLIIINLFIKYSWKFYNYHKISKNNPFPEFVRSNFELDDREQIKLFRETHQIKFYYQSFVGPLPNNHKGDYVNFNKKTGRKTFNQTNTCKKNILFFGGSTTFGWLSTDEKTIPSYFSKNLLQHVKNVCVFNFGSPWFYSKQENNYLVELVEKNSIKPDLVIFLDGVNEICNGFVYDKNLREQFDEIIVDHRTDIINKKILPFLRSMPIYQFIDRLVTKKMTQISILNESSNCSEKELKNLFEARLKLRLDICKAINFECVSFLQPFGGIHGKVYPISKELKNQQMLMYQEFKNIPENIIIDISNVLDDNSKNISYVDPLHYSHEANEKISKEIISKLKLMNKI
jgi:lysophospholipase L1-like esterase